MSNGPASWADTVELTRFRFRLLRDVFRLHGGGVRGLAVMARGLLRRILGRDAFGLDRRQLRRFGPEEYREWLRRNPDPVASPVGRPLHLVVSLAASGWLEARWLLESARDLGGDLLGVSLIPGPGDRLGEELCQDLAAETERWLGERPVRVGRLADVEAPCLVVFRPGRLWTAGVQAMLEALELRPDAIAAYADEDRQADGLRDCPWFKPAYDADLLLQGGLLGSAVLLPPGELELGPRPLELDLLIHLAGAAEDRLVHVPAFAFSAAPPYAAPTPLAEAHRRLAGHLGERERKIADGRWVSDGTRVELRHDPAAPEPGSVPEARLPSPPPKASVIIPTRDRVDLLARCLESLESKGGHPEVEVVILDNDSEDLATRDFLAQVQQDGRAVVVPAPGPFNFSALCNLGAEASQGAILIFLNDDTEVRTPGAVRELAFEADRSGVGAVGARLWYPDGSLQHGGLLLGVLGLVGTAYPRWQVAGARGPHPMDLLRGVSAVTGACLAIRRDRFGAVGGFDEVSFPVAFNDVDLCLRLRAAGLRNLVTPRADMLHAELASRAGEDSPAKRARFAVEAGRLRDRWGDALWADPSWSPCLGLDRGDGYPAFRARGRGARTGALELEE